MAEHWRTGPLAEAGLRFLGMVAPDVPLIPPTTAAFAGHFPLPEGRFDAVSVEFDDPHLRDRCNAEWHRLCSDGGLVAAGGSAAARDGGFLVAVLRTDDDGRRVWWWARVGLDEPWDIIGAGAASGALGAGWCHPGFVMLSADGRNVVRGDEGQSSVEIVLVRDPQRVPRLREHGARTAGQAYTDPFTRAAIERWLAATADDADDADGAGDTGSG
ncbi:hypothetical protein [Yinghuangia sp. YIM S09857]|uniref:hypothetical protein n=1 Tax=Yinghuangia sp. YIM S09857 TaxID=3436929 RepID=UPI003F53436A